MPKLFEHTQIKDLKLSNRFIRSATWEGLADENGACTPDLVERMVELAERNADVDRFAVGRGVVTTHHALQLREFPDHRREQIAARQMRGARRGFHVGAA